MSLALIQESAKEVRRLAIAGSPLAVGDFRLKKLATPLEQAGAKAPVFAQVAKAIGDLVDGDEAHSPERLLTLSTLLNAILHTQGETGIEGVVKEISTTPVTNSATRAPARVLRPLQEALTRTGDGRFELVKSAVDAGAFHDLRLVDPAIQALGDAYPELADLVAEKVLPGFGPGIASRLKVGLNLKGKKQDARRLEVLHRVAPATALPLCKAALEDGAPDVKAAAIACLGEHEDCLPLVLEQAKAKNKQVKAAALEALARYERPEITRLFRDLLTGESLELLFGPFRIVRNATLVAMLLDEGRRVFDLMLKGDSELSVRYCEILDCLAPRREPDVEVFLLMCFEQQEQIANLKMPKNSHLSGADLVVRLAEQLFRIGSAKSHEALLAKREELPAAAFDQVLKAAFKSWTAAQIFDEFSPLFAPDKDRSKPNRRAVILMSALVPSLRGGFSAHPDDSADFNHLAPDPRWLDTAIAADSHTAVCLLARPGHPNALTYVLNLIHRDRTLGDGIIVEGLLNCQYPDVTAVFLDLASKASKSTRYVNHEIRSLFKKAGRLPAADLPRLEAFAATLDEKFMEPFLEALTPLRSTTPTA